MRLLDLFAGAGGSAVGYHRAGFEVVGVDHVAQPNYPFKFWQEDALKFLQLDWPQDIAGNFDAIHASPPCQAYSSVSGRALKGNRRRYPDLVATVRNAMEVSGLPYVIENVQGAPLVNAVRLCGSYFGLDLHRHRLFECSFPVMGTPCSHHWQTPRFRSLDSRSRTGLAAVVGVHGHLNYPGEGELRARAMGIDWMTQVELTEAIPPAYTEHIGHYLMLECMARARAAA